MALSDYKRPDTVKVTVEGEMFEYILPTKWNRAYTRAWQEELAAVGRPDPNDPRQVAVSTVKLQDAQQQAFLDHCLVKAPLSHDELMGEYFPLLLMLFEEAMDAAVAEEARVDALAKKSLNGSTGTQNGKAKQSSTPSLNEKDELLNVT